MRTASTVLAVLVSLGALAAAAPIKTNADVARSTSMFRRSVVTSISGLTFGSTVPEVEISSYIRSAIPNDDEDDGDDSAANAPLVEV